MRIVYARAPRRRRPRRVERKIWRRFGAKHYCDRLAAHIVWMDLVHCRAEAMMDRLGWLGPTSFANGLGENNTR